MKRALVVDTVLAGLLSVGLFWLGAQLVTTMVVDATMATFEEVVVDGPNALPWFQVRVGCAWALAPLVGWVSSLPLHRAPAPRLVPRLVSVLLPVVAVAGSALFNVALMQLDGAAAGGIGVMVSVDFLPIERSAVVWTVCAGSLVLVFNWRKASQRA